MDRRASRLVTLGYIAVGLLIPAVGVPTLAPAQPARSSARIGVVRNQPTTDPAHQAFVVVE